MIVAATYGLARYSYGLFLPSFGREFAVSRDVLGLIASGSYAGYIAATLFGSWISSLTGPRLPVVLGGTFATLGILIVATARSPWALALGVMVAGASPGLSYPPLSDAVMRLVRRDRQNRAYTTINSGTSLGVILAGPLALWAGGDWRWAWVGFATFALTATLWNLATMPAGRYGGPRAPLPQLRWNWFVKPASYRLLAAATLLGLVTSVYWTFAVDLIVTAGELAGSRWPMPWVSLTPDAHSQVFWLVIGFSGLAGAAAGDLVTMCGIRLALRTAVMGIALAMGGIVIAPTNAIVVLGSAVLFGSTFILTTGLLGIWSVHVFQDRPSAGFGATFLLISLGQLVSPAVSGFTAVTHGLVPVFYAATLLTISMAFLVPRVDIKSMAR
jgi:predicted MFS family arabinose efflux permease